KEGEVTKDIPIIFVTASTDNLDEEKGLRMGAIDYIRKPFCIPVAKIRIQNHLRLKRKSDLLAQLVRIDGLTDIANRRGFDEALEQEWKRCKRQKKPISLIMIDIDHFKLFNDTYGHAHGDACLVKVAHTIALTLKRPGDIVARYGGEEFAVLLPDTSLSQAFSLAEKIRAAVAGLAIPHIGSPETGHVTISLGVTSMLPGATPVIFCSGVSLEVTSMLPGATTPSGEDLTPAPTGADNCIDMIRFADEALYQAKARGRNRVSSQEPALEKGFFH
ncbi:MAG: diguanylate cyclase, partial [Desulfamplus sp.]|nr:diguanylate cyclase [Desulfamplus sp.]